MYICGIISGKFTDKINAIQIKMKLTIEAVRAIKDNPKLRARLSYVLERHVDTITRYAESNDIMLTVAAAIQAIEEETGLTKGQILSDYSTAKGI